MKSTRLSAMVTACALALSACCPKALQDFRIVYSSAAEDEEGIEAAVALQGMIAEKCGVALDVVADTAAAAGCEIVVGDVDSPSFYASKHDAFDYSVKVAGKRMYVCGGSCWALKKASAVLADHLSDGNAGRKFSVSGSVYGECLFPLADGANLRILDDNIWEYKADTNAIVWAALGEDCRNEVRARGFAALAMAYMPDVFSMQEYAANMDVHLAPLMKEAGYLMSYDPSELWSYTPIWYNPKTVELIESSYHRHVPEEYNNRGTKSFNTAVLKHIATGRIFIVVSTHLWWKKDSVKEGSTEARAAQVRDIIAAVEKLLKKYRCPVFLMGDMNCVLDSKPMRQLLDKGYVPVWNVATVFGDGRNGHHDCSERGFSRRTTDFYDDRGKGAIDQFMVYNAGDAEIRVFKRIQPYFTIKLTDHYPNYCDIAL